MSLAYLEHYTVRDYEQWEGNWELIQGAPYAMAPSPTVTHQQTNGDIYFALKKSLAECAVCQALFEIDWKIAHDTVVRPDLLVVCDLDGNEVNKVPELIVEVVSPTSAKRDEQIKFELYQKEGVKTYMLVYPENQVAKVYVLKEGRFIKFGDFMQESYTTSIKGCDLSIDFSQVWARP